MGGRLSAAVTMRGHQPAERSRGTPTVPKTTIHLVRHGHVENPDRVLYGRLPGFNLSARGRAQGEALGRHFAAIPLAGVLSSPLERAQQTAAAIAAPHSLRVESDERLIEASSVFEGVAGNVGWYILRHPGIWWRLRDLRTPSWGERNVDLAERVQAVVNAAGERFPGQQVVLVSHQAPIWVARLAFERRPLGHWPGRRRCSLGSVTALEFNGDRLERVSYAEPAAAALTGAEPGRAGA
jgi:broad specificity phosphatase PhoE